MIFRFLLTIIFFQIISISQTIDLNENIKKGFESINHEDAYNYCKKLASDEFEGRLTGHEGYTKAGNWAAEQFEQWGITPYSTTNGFLQPYNAPYTQLKEASMSLTLHSGENLTLETAVDYLPLLFSDSGKYNAELVFAGWGISAPALDYDDYAGIDVKGKVVICFRGQPDRQDTSFFKHDHHRKRMQTAFEKGALGLIYIYPKVQANPNGDRIEGFMPAVISEKITDKILVEKDYTSSALRKKLTNEKKPNSFYLSTKVQSKVKAEYFPEATGYNIVGFVEGSDPELKKECIVVGGHFDHCGNHAGLLFAGANDNASGSAVVMEIAQAYGQLATKPKRSIMFVLFGSEEKGLDGSNYIANNFPKQFSKIDALFNFDMVGEGEGCSYGTVPEPIEFNQTIERADKYVNTIRRHWEIKNIGVRSGDISAFYYKRALVSSFFSNGPHLHYHETGDTIYRINPDVMKDIARLGFLSSFFWADR